MTLIELFADFICSKTESLQEADYLAKKSMIDCVGAMIAGSGTEVVRRVEPLAVSKGNTTVAGFGRGYSARDAAFINGIAAHELELDDTSSSNLGHPTAAVLPALLALGEELCRSGAEVLRSFLIASEIECKLGRICARELHRKGWHASSITGVIGAAAGCSFLLRQDREKTMHCLGIAASMASGVRENFGTSTKSVHIGKTAEDGVLAALLAEAGITSSPSALDGKEGYLYEYAGLRWEELGEGFDAAFAATLGNEYDVCSPGFAIKQYPSCSSTHRAVDALVDLIRTHSIAPEDIEEISVGLSQSALRELVTPYPHTPDEAKFSIGFQIALHLLGIDNMPENYTEDVIWRPEVQEIVQKTKSYNERKYNDLPVDMGVGPALANIRLRDGREFCAERIYPVGHLTDPISDEGIREKFLKCCRGILTEEKSEKLYRMLFSLEEQRDIRALMALCY